MSTYRHYYIFLFRTLRAVPSTMNPKYTQPLQRHHCNSHFRNAFSTATSLELDDDFDVSVQTDNNRTMNASFNISTNIESQEEITEK